MLMRNEWTHHESSQSTWLDPTIDMVQNSPGFLLDLDIVNHILPTENSSLPLDNTFVNLTILAFLDIGGFGRSVSSVSRFGIVLVLVLECLGDSTSLEYEDFTLGLLSGNVF